MQKAPGRPGGIQTAMIGAAVQMPSLNGRTRAQRTVGEAPVAGILAAHRRHRAAERNANPVANFSRQGIVRAAPFACAVRQDDERIAVGLRIAVKLDNQRLWPAARQREMRLMKKRLRIVGRIGRRVWPETPAANPGLAATG